MKGWPGGARVGPRAPAEARGSARTGARGAARKAVRKAAQGLGLGLALWAGAGPAGPRAAPLSRAVASRAAGCGSIAEVASPASGRSGGVADRQTSVPADTLPEPLSRELPVGLEAFGQRARPEPELVALGRSLFFAPELSRDRTVACASCHRPDHGFADDRPLSVGIDGQLTLRNAPTLLNKALDERFSWDGRAESLEEQVLLPIQNPLEMDQSLEQTVSRLAGDPAWSARFEKALGKGPDPDGMARALAAFVSELTYGDTAVDRFRAGQTEALGPAERSGLWLFESKAGCWRCHEGPRFSDGSFHNTGVGARAGFVPAGRMAVTGRPADRGKFKTPGLRGLRETGPYMHDGSLETLDEVIAFYRAGAGPNPGLDPALHRLDLSDAEADHLVAFLEALSH